MRRLNGDSGLLGVGSGVRRRGWGRAMTLVELVIALAITAIVAAVLAILIDATAVGTSSNNDGRRGLTRMQAMKAQLGDAFANARCILAVDATHVVYWVGDVAGAPTPANGAVNFSELRMLELDTTTGSLNLYTCQWPSGYSTASIIAADQTYAAGSDWLSAAQAAKGTGNYPATLVAGNVTGITACLDSASPTQAHLIQLRVDIDDGSTPRSVIIGAALQSQAAPM